MVAILAIFLLRPPRARALAPRTSVGDQVSTSDGLSGTVVRLDGAFVLVDAGGERRVWARGADLLVGDGTTAVPGDSSGHAAAEGPPPPAVTDASGFLPRFAEGVWTARTTVVWAWALAVLICVPLASTAEKSFVSGGFLIEGGEAIQVLDDVQDQFHMAVGQQVMIVPGPLADAQERIAKIRPDLMRTPHVLNVTDPRPSTDGKLVAVDIQFSTPDDTAINSFEPLLDVFESAGYPRKEVLVAGMTSVNTDMNLQTKRDLKKAEMIGIPLAMIVLLIVFGTFMAAIVPLVVGFASVVLTLALLHLISMPLGLSIFVMNIASMLGFGLGIDYSLLGVSRFRDELAHGRTVHQAVVTTIVTSGRAAAISGIAVLAGVAALAAIPLPVMFAIAIGGIVVVSVTVFASLTMLPAMLAVLGHNIERGRVRRIKPPGPIEQDRWYRLAKAVMRKPGLAIFAGLAFLMVLASPVLSARLDIPHGEIFGPTAPSVIARTALEQRFDEQVKSPVVLIVDTIDEEKLYDIQTRLLAVKKVQKVEVILRDEASGRTLLDAFGDPTVGAGGVESRALAARVKALDLPVKASVSGQGAGESEYLDVLRRTFPHTLLLIMVSTMIILTLAFRSIALPLKAIILDSCSLLASLGVVVAVFQHGIGIELLGSQALGYTEPTIPIILFCVLFGLSMDYEVFMLAKVSELYQQGYDNREATARGVAMTAPLVTGAALILIAIGIAFATTELVVVKEIGFGMAVALTLDATIVRAFLIPATMSWLGPRNWWLPVALQRRIPRVSWSH